MSKYRTFCADKFKDSISPKLEFISYNSCCMEDLPLSDRQFDMGFQEFVDSSYSKPILNLLLKLSSQNKSIVFFGDSMNEQFFSAFITEGLREGLTFRNYVNISVPEMQRSNYWENCIYRNHSRVILYLFRTNDYDEYSSEYKVYQRIKELNHNHYSGLIVIGNIGLHLPDRIYPEPYPPLYSHRHKFLEYLHYLAVDNHLTIPIFRQTTPTFFNSSSHNGMYEVYDQDFRLHKRDRESSDLPNSWDGTNYYCRENTAPLHAGNLAISRILQTWGPTSNVQVLRVYDRLLPFYKNKNGFCGKALGKERKAHFNLDFVHFCGFNPISYMPIWKDLQDIIDNYQYYDVGILKTDKPVLISSNGNNEKMSYLFHHGMLSPINDTESSISHFIITEKLIHVKRDISKLPLGEFISLLDCKSILNRYNEENHH